MSRAQDQSNQLNQKSSTASSRGCHAGSSNSGETVIGFASVTVGRKAAPFCRRSARRHCAQNSWLLAGALLVLVVVVVPVLVLMLVLVVVLVLMLVLLSAWCLLWLLARSPKGNPPPSKAVVGVGERYIVRGRAQRCECGTAFGGQKRSSSCCWLPGLFIAARDLRGGLGVEISRLWAPAELLVAKPWLCMRALPRAVTGLLP